MDLFIAAVLVVGILSSFFIIRTGFLALKKKFLPQRKNPARKSCCS